MVSFSSMAIAGRELSSALDTFEILMYRSFIGIVLVVVIGAATGSLKQISTGQIKLHTLRNVSHFAGQNLWFYAVASIPLAQVFALEFTTPLWVALFAPMVLGEKMTRTRLLAAGLGFIGILIVARPDHMVINAGVISAGLCALGFAGSVLTTKMLSRHQSIISIMFWMVAMQAIFGLITAGYDGNIAVPDAQSMIWITVVSCAGLFGHFCITKALSVAPATVVSPLEFLRLPLIAFVGLVLYNEPLLSTVFIGAVVVFAANLMNILAEQRRRVAPA